MTKHNSSPLFELVPIPLSSQATQQAGPANPFFFKKLLCPVYRHLQDKVKFESEIITAWNRFVIFYKFYVELQALLSSIHGMSVLDNGCNLTLCERLRSYSLSSVGILKRSRFICIR